MPSSHLQMQEIQITGLQNSSASPKRGCCHGKDTHDGRQPKMEDCLTPEALRSSQLDRDQRNMDASPTLLLRHQAASLQEEHCASGLCVS